MQSKTFSQLSFLVAVIVTGIVLVKLAERGVSSLPLPESAPVASSTPRVSSSEPEADPYFIISYATTSIEVSDPEPAQPTVFVHTSKAAISTAPSTKAPALPKLMTIPLRTPLGDLKAMVASTSAAREQGLSDRASMPQDTGMLFMFDTPEKYGFWMKDMRFPLDIIWILPDKKVASIYRNVKPDSYPRVYYSRLFVSYVLELNAGGAAKWGIATGTQLYF